MAQRRWTTEPLGVHSRGVVYVIGCRKSSTHPKARRTRTLCPAGLDRRLLFFICAVCQNPPKQGPVDCGGFWRTWSSTLLCDLLAVKASVVGQPFTRSPSTYPACRSWCQCRRYATYTTAALSRAGSWLAAVIIGFTCAARSF
ncbi:hypothetical protein BDW02DRAFT_95372 [Decorospora gaudefroyi]|uniref:Uncharacterized protein n=1 Tax=Decorospora gaudefroyi TaxID=184978 RepID=A0A6A5K1D1_9PLEO|nr:hypothetical protein BDW02DRAFT_95372 [Decorospora gaudefroyi]